MNKFKLNGCRKERIMDLQSGDRFTVDGGTSEVFTFDHLDGMYSHIWTEDRKVVHFFISTEVTIVQ